MPLESIFKSTVALRHAMDEPRVWSDYGMQNTQLLSQQPESALCYLVQENKQLCIAKARKIACLLDLTFLEIAADLLAYQMPFMCTRKQHGETDKLASLETQMNWFLQIQSYGKYKPTGISRYFSHDRYLFASETRKSMKLTKHPCSSTDT